jgi:4-hydroxy-tetrahydrodipicolinate synthase
VISLTPRNPRSLRRLKSPSYVASLSVSATSVFDRYCPLLRYEFQPKIGLAFRKHVYKRRGVFATDHIRPPGLRLDPRSVQELEATIARVGLPLEPVGAA